MDVERALVSKIVATGNIEDVISKGITAEMFLPLEDDGAREVYEFVVNHHRKYKSTPSQDALRYEFEDWEFEHIEDGLGYIIDRMAGLVRKRHATELLYSLGEAVADKKRSQSIELEFLEAARDLATLVPTTEVERLSDMDKRVEKYEKDELEGVKPGIPFGFPTLDTLTGGVQPHEFVTCAAFSGVGKSTLLRAVAFNMYTMPDDVVMLYVALEEEGASILRKFDAMYSGLDYMKLKSLGLEPDQVDMWREKAEECRKNADKRNVIVASKLRHCTPDMVYAETVKHSPDIIFVDYLSLMRSAHTNNSRQSMWQNLTDITQDLKQNARVLGVPIIAAAQTNRSGAADGADLGNIGYSLSVVQDSDIVIGLHADDEMKEENKMEMRVRKNREGPLGPKIDCIWNHGESDFREDGTSGNWSKASPVTRKGGKDKARHRAMGKAAFSKTPGAPKKKRPTKPTAKRQRPTRAPAKKKRPVRSAA